MAMNDPLAAALSKLDNASRTLNKEVTLKRSKLLREVLEVLKKNSYVGTYEEIEDGKQGLFKVNLLGTVNSCKAIKPRFSVALDELETYEQRFLPAKDFGVLIISTNKGLLTQKEMKEENIGGTLLGVCY
jgi:small subunit ribosomal protein S8